MAKFGEEVNYKNESIAAEIIEEIVKEAVRKAEEEKRIRL